MVGKRNTITITLIIKQTSRFENHSRVTQKSTPGSLNARLWVHTCGGVFRYERGGGEEREKREKKGKERGEKREEKRREREKEEAPH